MAAAEPPESASPLTTTVELSPAVLPRPRPSPRPGAPSRPKPPRAGRGHGHHDAPGGAVDTADHDAPTRAADVPVAVTGPAGNGGPFHGVGMTVLVSELERSVSFYRDQLGFTEVDRGEATRVLAWHGTRLVLRQATDLGAVRHRLVHLNLEVSDIDSVYADLKANGVRFTSAPRAVEQTASQELWAAAFRDPDGHGLALTQWRPAATTG